MKSSVSSPISTRPQHLVPCTMRIGSSLLVSIVQIFAMYPLTERAASCCRSIFFLIKATAPPAPSHALFLSRRPHVLLMKKTRMALKRCTLDTPLVLPLFARGSGVSAAGSSSFSPAAGPAGSDVQLAASQAASAALCSASCTGSLVSPLCLRAIMGPPFLLTGITCELNA